LIENSHHPLVSVILPCYKMGRFIGDALESVGKQTYTNWEVIAVDDCGPQDGSKEAIDALAKSFPSKRIVYHRHEKNGGVSAARNTAIGLARGDVIALLDPDDSWGRDHLQVHVDVFRRNPDVLLSYSQANTLDENGQILERPTGFYNFLGVAGVGIPGKVSDGYLRAMMTRMYVPVSSACLQRNVLLDLGGFQTGMKFQVEDWVMWARIGKRGPVYFTELPTAYYRIHPQSFSNLQKPIHDLKNNIEFVFAVGDHEGQSDTLTQAIKRITTDTLIYKTISRTKRIWCSFLIFIQCVNRGWWNQAVASLKVAFTFLKKCENPLQN
jgi:glycosyltransferase involved in cell wall biosynthesis